MENKDYLNGCLDENSLDDLAEAFDTGLNENDDLLVRSFFADNRIDIADDGFTERVMRRLPSQAVRLNRIWTVICGLAGIVWLLTLLPPVAVTNVKGCVWYFLKSIFEPLADRLALMDLSGHGLMTLGVVFLSFGVIGLCYLVDNVKNVLKFKVMR